MKANIKTYKFEIVITIIFLIITVIILGISQF